MVTVSELDVHDEARLREFWEVEQAAQHADRSHPVLVTYDRRVQLARHPAPSRWRLLLVAYDGSQVVGTADVTGSTDDNTHLAELEVNVLPSHRRRGVGRALHDEAVRRGRDEGRTTFIGEACQPSAAEPSPATSFASALGFSSAHREDHLVLDLPTSTDLALEHPPRGHEVVTWTNRAPADLVAAYARMRTQMNHDVPTGDLDLEPTQVSVEQVRAGEERLASGYETLVAAARRDDGELDGYSLAFLPRGECFVQQDDTFVVATARGAGIGRALKLAVLRTLAARWPERNLVHTWTSLDNEAMQRLNRGLGFRAVELMHEMQRQDVG